MLFLLHVIKPAESNVTAQSGLNRPKSKPPSWVRLPYDARAVDGKRIVILMTHSLWLLDHALVRYSLGKQTEEDNLNSQEGSDQVHVAGNIIVVAIVQKGQEH